MLVQNVFFDRSRNLRRRRVCKRNERVESIQRRVSLRMSNVSSPRVSAVFKIWSASDINSVLRFASCIIWRRKMLDWFECLDFVFNKREWEKEEKKKFHWRDLTDWESSYWFDKLLKSISIAVLKTLPNFLNESKRDESRATESFSRTDCWWSFWLMRASVFALCHWDIVDTPRAAWRIREGEGERVEWPVRQLINAYLAGLG